jgi:thiamine pyrophosphate-dependent acetolactate synthase large subunit-like protein
VKVYEALAQAIREEGVKAIFGLMGDGNMDMLATVLDHGEIPVYHARHEGAALAMADGYARASGDVGVCAVTSGPGVTQLGTSLMVANRRGTPLVVIGGDTHTTLKGMGGHQDMDQRAFVEASGALWHALRGPNTVEADLQHAFRLARTRRQPVFLNCPVDIQEAEGPRELTYTPSKASLGSRIPLQGDAAAVEKAADMVAAAQRPLIVAGDGAMAAGARDAIDALADRIGAALATTVRAKGYLDGPWSIGVVGSFSSIRAEPIATAADLVIFAGCSGNPNTMAGIPPTARTLQIDTNHAASLAGRSANHLVVGDVRVVLEEVEKLMAGAGFSAGGYRVSSYQDAFQIDPLAAELSQVEFDLPPRTVDPRRVIQQLDGLLPDEASIVIGVGHFWSFPTMYLNGRRKRRFIFTYDFGCIGQAIPTSFGVAIAEPSRPVICFEGDASAMMSVHVMDVTGRYQPHLLVFIINDGALGAEYHKLSAKKLNPDWSLVPTPDLAKLAQAFGNAAGTVTDVDELEREVKAFNEGEGTRYVDVRTSPTAISRPYRMTYFASDK